MQSVSCIISSQFTACYLIVLFLQQVLLLPSDLACLQSPGRRRGTLKNAAWFGFIMDISILCFKACLQLVKVSTVYLYFLREASLWKYSPKKTSTSLRSAHVNIVIICTIRMISSVSQVFKALYSLLLLESVQFVITTWKRPVSERYSPKMPRTTKNSSCTIDNNQSQEDSRAHEESSSDQEHDQEVFLQPSQAQLIPNMCRFLILSYVIIFVDDVSKTELVGVNRQAFIQPQLNFIRSEENPTLLWYLLMLRWPKHMLWIQSMPRMPYVYLQMPIDWNGLGMHLPFGRVYFKARDVKTS